MLKYNSKLLKDYELIHVGVSMGLDSVVMSHFLARGMKQLMLINVNHKTEHGESCVEPFNKYCEWLKTQRQQHNKPPELWHTVSGAAGDTTGFNEAQLRDYRYGVFDNGFRDSQNEALIMCHHLDDAVESYLMNTFTGKVTGRHPLPISTTRTNYKVLRPFIRTKKKNIIKYAQHYDLMKWVKEDKSNEDLTIRRNWIRLKLRPEIESEYGSLNKVVAKKYNQTY